MAYACVAIFTHLKRWRTSCSAIAVCGPYEAVKEQCSGLYAQLRLNGASSPGLWPIFQQRKRWTAEVSFLWAKFIQKTIARLWITLLLLSEVEKESIGILGICGFGAIYVNSAVQDTRLIKAGYPAPWARLILKNGGDVWGRTYRRPLSFRHAVLKTGRTPVTKRLLQLFGIIFTQNNLSVQHLGNFFQCYCQV